MHRKDNPVTQSAWDHAVEHGLVSACEPPLAVLETRSNHAGTWNLWWYSGVPRMSYILRISSDMENDLGKKLFSAHYTSIWKFNRISRTTISKVPLKCILWAHHWGGDVQRLATASRGAGSWGEIVQWGMKLWSKASPQWCVFWQAACMALFCTSKSKSKNIFTRGQFWPSGIVVASICLSVCAVSTCLSAR